MDSLITEKRCQRLVKRPQAHIGCHQRGGQQGEIDRAATAVMEPSSLDQFQNFIWSGHDRGLKCLQITQRSRARRGRRSAGHLDDDQRVAEDPILGEQRLQQRVRTPKVCDPDGPARQDETHRARRVRLQS